MQKKNWLKSPFILIGLVVVVGLIILACGDFGGDDYYTSSFFPPEITHEENFNEFFYTPHSLYLSDHKDSYIADFNSVNIDEWGDYFKKQVKDKDLEYILYKARPGEIDTLIFSIKNWSYPINAELKKNSVLKVSDNRSALDFLYYIGFAKRCEKYVTYETFWWDDDKTKDPRNDKAGMARLIAGGQKQLTNTNTPFVQQRYAFQILRLYFISRDFGKCIEFYNQQKNLFETNANSIKYRAMGYAAGAYYGQKQFAEADYLYSLIYANSDIMRISAYLSFHPQEESDWKQTLALAKNDKEKATLWQMLGIYKDSFRAMKEVYAIDAKSDLLDMLLTRCVNKEEERFLMRFDMMTLIQSKHEDSISHFESYTENKELVDFIQKVADKENTLHPYVWDLAAGYMEWAYDTNIFQKYLNKAKSESKGDSLVKDEVRLIDLLDKVASGKTGSKAFEKDILPDLVWLRDSIHADYFPKDYAQQFITGELALKYWAIGDTVKFTCFSTANNEPIIQDASVLEKLEKLIDKKNKTPFEQYALGKFSYTNRDLLGIEAVNLLYDYKFSAALAKLNEDDSAGMEPLYGFDPLDIQINDCHDCDAARDSDIDPIAGADTSSFNTKKGFTERMVKLENSIKTDPAHLAENYFLMANGFYNMTYFGNNRVLYDSKATHMEYVYFYPEEFEERVVNTGELVNPPPIYLDCSKAEEYYNKAAAASKDVEFKAKCIFMAAKCEQNNFFVHKPKDYEGDFKAGKYFAILKANYSQTNYYKEIIQECGYFKTYSDSK